MPKRIATDAPLSEITLRKYEVPQRLNDRELVRKLCLSLGLLQPGDSRDIVVDVFLVLLRAKRPLTSTQVEKKVIAQRKRSKRPLLGIAPSNIRRQLLRLRDLFLVEKTKHTYGIRERSRLSSLFDEHIQAYYLQAILGRVHDYLKEADRRFLPKNK